MKRIALLGPFAAWLVLGPSGCFSSSSNAPSTNGELLDAGGPDATSHEAGTVDKEASTVDAEGGTDAPDDAGSDIRSDAEASAGDGSPEAAPPIDAGAGCLPPGTESPLSPTTEGLPSNGLALWLRADHGVHLTAANRVCAWADESGNGNTFSNLGSTRPLLVGLGGDGGIDAGQDGVGGRPAVYFDAPGSALGVGGLLGIAATQARTFIVVTRMVATAGRFQSIAQGSSGSAGTYVMIDANTWQSAGDREGVYVTSNSYDTALATSTAPRVHVFTIETLTPSAMVAGNTDYRVNGATQSLTLKSGSGIIESFSAANYTSIGNPNTTNTVGSAGTGVIAEVIVYSRALDVTERASVETALMARYGIP